MDKFDNLDSFNINGEEELNSQQFNADRNLENKTRIIRLEEIVFARRDSLTSRVRALEIFQEVDENNWKSLQSEKNALAKKIEIIDTTAKILSIPGGTKTLIAIFMVLQFGYTFAAEMVIHEFNLGDVKEAVEKR
ncbi:hypothetical protein [Cylindrospermum sp. FACHB-282]|uniref:hypothetical protein n=1 Tax=Cylindrospermum sp. FACHB-282 TaxID=2692794 RepID=UPI0016861F5E|nr:hypothetical protein [Cylindrospermum sp. FACHB-282]MBD2385991.1 hypothetical protein [Cylindrospermum sp. FACHB-282]